MFTSLARVADVAPGAKDASLAGGILLHSPLVAQNRWGSSGEACE
jgi:hypothetical protein